MSSGGILIVEDNPDEAEGVALRLGQYGFSDVRKAYRYGEALRLIAEKKPECVILDLVLPCAKPYIEMIDELTKKWDCAVVVATGMGDQAVVGRCITAGASAVLIKTKYTPGELWEAVMRAIRDSRALDKFSRTEQRFRKIEESVGELKASIDSKKGGLPAV